MPKGAYDQHWREVYTEAARLNAPTLEHLIEKYGRDKGVRMFEWLLVESINQVLVQDFSY